MERCWIESSYGEEVIKALISLLLASREMYSEQMRKAHQGFMASSVGVNEMVLISFPHLF